MRFDFTDLEEKEGENKLELQISEKLNEGSLIHPLFDGEERTKQESWTRFRVGGEK